MSKIVRHLATNQRTLFVYHYTPKSYSIQHTHISLNSSVFQLKLSADWEVGLHLVWSHYQVMLVDNVYQI